MSASPGTISRLLINSREGDQTALDQLMPLVSRELRRLAHQHLRRQKHGQTLQTTEPIDEAYLRLVDHKHMRWQNRGHFYAVAAQAMRRILVDRARTRVAAKRGGGQVRVSLDEGATIA